MLVAFALAGHPAWYLVLWLLPWLTLWRVVTGLRLMAEHGGLVPTKDRRLTTDHVRQRFVSRLFLVPSGANSQCSFTLALPGARIVLSTGNGSFNGETMIPSSAAAARTPRAAVTRRGPRATKGTAVHLHVDK